MTPSVDTEQWNIVEKQNKVSISEQPTYAAVKKKNKLMKRKKSGQNQNSAAEEKGEKVKLCSLTATDKLDIKREQKNHDQIQHKEATFFVNTTESSEALYTAVKKKPKDKKADNKVKVPSPSHSVEELYTAVKKNVKGSDTKEEEGAPQLLPHTVEDLYTAVMKKPKNDPTTDNPKAAPPIPPHTIEELYMAIQKGNTRKDEEEAPPIPPHTVEDC